MPSIRSQLEDFLKTATDWEKMETPLRGISVSKVPETKTRGPKLNIVVKPTGNNGLPLKKRGLFISSYHMLEGFLSAFKDDRAELLIRIIEHVNRGEPFVPEEKPPEPSKIEDIPAMEEVEEVEEFIFEDEEEEEEETEIEPSVDSNAEMENIAEILEKEYEEEEEKQIIDLNPERREIDVDIEEPIEKTDELEEELEEKAPRKKDSKKKSNRLYVDITNILYDLANGSDLRVKDIMPLYEMLKLRGYDPKFIADASTRHKVDDQHKFDALNDKEIIKLAPGGRAADIFILKMARKFSCKFLSNDMFRDYYEDFGEDWIKDHRLTYMNEDGEIIID